MLGLSPPWLLSAPCAAPLNLTLAVAQALCSALTQPSLSQPARRKLHLSAHPPPAPWAGALEAAQALSHISPFPPA